MIYLSSPYTHRSPAVRQKRFADAQSVVADFLSWEIPVFSPIVYSHKIATTYGLPTEAAFWAEINSHFADASTDLLVLKLDGWKDSVGIKTEIGWFDARGITPIYFTVQQTEDLLQRLLERYGKNL